MRNDFFSKLFESCSTVPYIMVYAAQSQAGAVKLLLSVVKCVPRKEKVTFANHCNFASKLSKFRAFFLYSFPDSNFLSNFRIAKRPYCCLRPPISMQIALRMHACLHYMHSNTCRCTTDSCSLVSMGE